MKSKSNGEPGSKCSNTRSRFRLKGLLILWLAAIGNGAAYGQLFISTLEGGISGHLGTVEEYTTSGAPISSPLISGTLEWPGDLAVSSGGYLYVVNNAGGTVGQYTLSGAVVNASLIAGLFDPWGITIDDGNLFIASGDADGYQNTGSVGEYTTAGQVLNASLITGLNRSYGVVGVGSDLFVTEEDGGTVAEYTTSGALVNGSLISGLNYPFDIVSDGEYLYVGTGNGVGKYTMTGQTVNATLITGLSQPTGLALDADGDLFVAQTGADSISEYTVNGATINADLISVPNAPSGIVVVPEPSLASFAVLALIAICSVRRGRYILPRNPCGRD